MILDLSLKNKELYKNIEIFKTGGKESIDLSDEALNIIGENANNITKKMTDRSEIVLTGPASIPVYLVVFHIIVHRFRKVIYDNEMYRLNIARH
jgi:hypothetical protein